MASTDVTLTIRLDSEELADLGKKFNVLERLRSLEFDVERLEREKAALSQRVQELSLRLDDAVGRVKALEDPRGL